MVSRNSDTRPALRNATTGPQQADGTQSDESAGNGAEIWAVARSFAVIVGGVLLVGWFIG
jgi:hypothetical protein